ncbi:Palmitoyl-CoA hydrolase [Rhizorhabdus wittichii RW1]|uniref:Palmitoyl-CoA hydrolase n=1 Tax=Rhizorhabdus wittichii (strain DSM 6014 / CCUG 31198 / JCM 15750 / NBRC 105917 / EY 4224 / RW1) TaxID=392499 RepID=A0A9J9LDV7_RHIWR|nr:Palmitoyl-CoA hydrolase [Rhizorhabdus wittichii RW1]
MITVTNELHEQARQDRIAMLRRLIDRMGRIAPAEGDGDRFLIEPAIGAFDRVYGGQSLAEALIAAARTVDQGRRLNSAHCYFLRLGDPRKPVVYVVDRLRDTRSFSVRQVRAEQDGQAIITATFSFAASFGGIEHQGPAADAPPPEEVLPRDVALLARNGGELPKNAGVPWPIDLRHVDQPPWDQRIGDGRHRVWMRADEELPDDPLLHACLLLYASDLTMADAVTNQHPIVWEDLIAARGLFGASLDHAFWLHVPARIDQWLLHVQESTRAADGRGFTTGRFYDRSGVLVASVAQEIFIKDMSGGTA